MPRNSESSNNNINTGAKLDPEFKQRPLYIEACFGSTLHGKYGKALGISNSYLRYSGLRRTPVAATNNFLIFQSSSINYREIKAGVNSSILALKGEYSSAGG
ncbi:hypothetical protein GE21DRAFT_1273213 [Neurospora crassa]|nr:hypothetical protein GE21DRAFT_1273213 [Neurospora crassa]